jgi:hypothetical protein
MDCLNIPALGSKILEHVFEQGCLGELKTEEAGRTECGLGGLDRGDFRVYNIYLNCIFYF